MINQKISYIIYIFFLLIFYFLIAIFLLIFLSKNTNDKYNKLNYFLKELNNNLIENNIESKIVRNLAIIRIDDSNMIFPIGKANLEKTKTLDNIVKIINSSLNCHVKNYKNNLNQCPNHLSKKYICKNPLNIKLSSIFIEGHADLKNIKKNAKYKDNMDLSYNRAKYISNYFHKCLPYLNEFKNDKSQKIFTLASHSNKRPSYLDNLDKNRRIEIRFLLE